MSTWISNRNLKLIMFKTEVLTFTLEPSLLIVFPTSVNGPSIHSIAEAKKLRVILESPIPHSHFHRKGMLAILSSNISHLTTSYHLRCQPPNLGHPYPLPAINTAMPPQLIYLLPFLSILHSATTVIFHESKSDHTSLPCLKLSIMLRIESRFLAMACMIWSCQRFPSHLLALTPLNTLFQQDTLGTFAFTVLLA